MKKIRFVQISLVLLLIVGLWIGLNRVHREKTDRSVIRWVPAEDQAAPEHEKNTEKKAEESPRQPVKENPEKARTDKRQKTEKPDVETEKKKEKKAEPEKKTWPDARPHLFRRAPGIISAELDSFGGYRVNDLIYGKLFENGAHEQRGEMDALRAYLGLLLNQLQPAGAPELRRVKNTLVTSDLDKWWFTKSEDTLEEGIKALEHAGGALKENRLRLKASPSNLTAIVDLYITLLKSEEKALLEGEPGFTETDNRFFHARGAANSCAVTLSDVEKSFSGASYFPEIKKDLDTAQAWLSRAVAMDPWLVMGGDPDELSSNHLVIMAFMLDKSRESLENLRQNLGREYSLKK